MSQTIGHDEHPLATPPPGEESNFINPPTRDAEIYIGMGITLAIASVTMLLRVYCRLALRQACALEDLFVWIGFAVIVAHDAVTFSITGSGPGRIIGAHEWNLTIKYFTIELLERNVTAVLLFNIGILFVKLSLFSIYLRLFSPNLLTRRLTYGGIAACSACYLTSFLTIIISCIPRELNDNAAWHAKQVQCNPTTNRVLLALGLFGTISDIYLLVIPIQMVLRLQLALKRKIGISAVFTTGILAITCSMISLVLRGQLLTSLDETWVVALVYILNAAEICAGIVCVNVPLLPAAFSQQVKRPIWTRWANRRTNSRKYLANAVEGINLRYCVSIEHGVYDPNEIVSPAPLIPAMCLNSNYGMKDQYRIDISAANLAKEP